MKSLAGCALVLSVVVNLVLGYCTLGLANAMRARLQTYGARVPEITLSALDMPPCFFLLGFVAFLSAVVGLAAGVAPNRLLSAAFGVLLLDIAFLLFALSGFTHVAVRM